MTGPRETRMRLYGYRKPNGEIFWFHRDGYGNGVSTPAKAVAEIRAFQDEYHRRTGSAVPVELVTKDRVTTVWERWLKPERTGEFIGATTEDS